MSAARRDPRVGQIRAGDALDTLVSQFADPLVFLRELVQNSLDAASTRVDVDFAFQPEARPGEPGLMTITVTDNGEGMNEGIIDRYLLTLFSSTKENDLTKIGKFGVGFVSIFAMEPDLVVLDTGQAGESWRILFHADRSFEKLASDEPIEGTSVALHRRVSAEMFEDLRARGAATVRYWCKFAAAEVCVDGAAISEPFGLDAALCVRHDEPGTSIVLGFAPPASDMAAGEAVDVSTVWGHESASVLAPVTSVLAPVVGFYNRGLTLMESDRAPESDAGETTWLAGLSVRIKSRYLEHTLTRDNVRQDENYARVMLRLRTLLGEELAPALIRHLEALAAHHSDAAAHHSDAAAHHADAAAHHSDAAAPHPGPPALALALLYAELPGVREIVRASTAAIIPTVNSGPMSVRALRSQDTPTRTLLSAREPNALTALLAKSGVAVVLAHPAVLAHLFARGARVRDANEALYTAVPVTPTPAAARCLARTSDLVGQAGVKVSRLALGDLSYPGSPVAGRLYVRQARAFGITRPGQDDTPRLLGGARELVLCSRHPLVASALGLSGRNTALAAQLLAQAICVVEAGDAARAMRLARVALRWRRDLRDGEDDQDDQDDARGGASGAGARAGEAAP